MTNPREVTETKIWDGSGGTVTVRPGDPVELLPTGDREHPDGEPGRSLSHYNGQFLPEFLGGSGPFPIAWIGRWPCGRVTLYLTTRKGEPGAHAKYFRPAAVKV